MDRLKNEEYKNAIIELISDEVRKVTEQEIAKMMAEKISTDIFEHKLEETIKEKVEETVKNEISNLYNDLAKIVENMHGDIELVKTFLRGVISINNVNIPKGDFNNILSNSDLKNINLQSLIDSDTVQNKYNEYNNSTKQMDFDFTNPNNVYVVENKLKYALDKRGWNQNDLAERTGITRSTIGNIVNNPSSASLINALKIAYVMGEDVQNLFWLSK